MRCASLALLLFLSRVHSGLRSAIADESGPQFKCQIVGCNRWFKSTLSYEGHYNTCHRYVRTPRHLSAPATFSLLLAVVQSCNTCGRMFPIARLQELHILETHDTLFALLAKKQHMVMPTLALAWLCTSDDEDSFLQYECLVGGCNSKFASDKDREKHLIDFHSYPRGPSFGLHLLFELTLRGRCADCWPWCRLRLSLPTTKTVHQAKERKGQEAEPQQAGGGGGATV